MEAKDQIEQIKTLSVRVASEHDAYESALASESAAQAEVLTLAIEAARPALRALSSRIKSSWRNEWHDRCYTSEHVSYHDARGVRLSGDAKAKEDHPRDNRGSYEGQGLYLLTDGMLAAVTWGGTWTRWQGESSHAESELHRYASPLECLDAGWELDEILEGLTKALTAQAEGQKAKATVAARERAERMAAIARLVK